MTTIVHIFLLLCLAAAVATVNRNCGRWARAEDTNRFLVEQINSERERLLRAQQQAERYQRISLLQNLN
ncbi:MAG: hypothetical protein LIO74_12370 [Ruminococcus sp.]|nr:hypothetical protein [Bacteroidales bacterium]MCC8112333.1 hypothetical protein [Ruminococcus sp.]